MSSASTSNPLALSHTNHPQQIRSRPVTLRLGRPQTPAGDRPGTAASPREHLAACGGRSGTESRVTLKGDEDATFGASGPGLGELDGQGHTLRGVPVEHGPGPITLLDMERYLRQMARLELGPDYEGAGIDFPAMAAARRDQSSPGHRPPLRVRGRGVGSPLRH